MKIYIDISGIAGSVNVTGIQRTVCMLAVNLIELGAQAILLDHNAQSSAFDIIDNDEFIKAVKNSEYSFGKIASVRPDELEFNSVFLDIGNGWHSPVRRADLLPVLKNRGIFIVCGLYDLIPLLYPAYSTENTQFRFLNYITSHLKYADAILELGYFSDELASLMASCGVSKPVRHIELGADFAASDKAVSDNDVSVQVKNAASRPYLLMVGTVEIRKNHGYAIDTIESCEDISLIIAGKQGWKADDVLKRIYEHPLFNKRIFYFCNASDNDIAYLYKNAFMVVNPSLAEGYGLPTVEALKLGVPAAVADIKVNRCVGKDHALYFDPNDKNSLADIVRNMLADENAYAELKSKIAGYTPNTWQNSAKQLIEAVNEFYADNTPDIDVNCVKQMFILTGRADSLLSSLPFIEEKMSFIKELVICCPQKIKDEIMNNYSGRLKLSIFCDEDVLGDDELPEDHQKRNLFLRCKAFRKEGMLDDVFIMGDDDYRPLKDIGIDYFTDGSSYNAYYSGDSSLWKYEIQDVYSYDHGQFRTNAFLSSHGFASLQYAVHQPQIINRKWYIEILDMFPGIESSGFDEWSTYFNISSTLHHGRIVPKVYETLCWPNCGEFFRFGTIPERFSFENFYPENYEGFFSGISPLFDKENFDSISKQKTDKAEKLRCAFIRWQENDNEFSKNNGDSGIAVYCGRDKLRISAPQHLEMKTGTVVPLNISCVFAEDMSDDKVKIFISFSSKNNFSFYSDFSVSPDVGYRKCVFSVPECSGKGEISVSCSNSSGKCSALIQTILK